LHLLKPFAERFGDGLGHALSGEPGQALGELVASLFLMFGSCVVDILPSSSHSTIKRPR